MSRSIRSTVVTFLALAVVGSGAATLLAPTAGAQSRLQRLVTWEQSFRGTEEQELRWPVAVAAASPEEILVADAFEPRALLFRKVGVSWQLAQSAPLPGVPVDAVHDGRAYLVSLRGGGGVVVLEPPKLTQRRLRMPRGVVPGPLALRPDGAMLVYDLAGGAVLQLTADGALAREIAVDGQVSGLAAAADGGFYASVADGARVLGFDAAGGLRTSWEVPAAGPVPAWPTALAVDVGGRVAVLDRHGGRVLFFDVGGKLAGVGSRHGWADGLLHHPSDLIWLEDGRLVVSDRGNGRFQVFRHLGRDASP